MSESNGPTSSKRRRLSWPVRIGVIIGGAVILAYLAVMAVLSTAWFNRVLIERTRAKLEQATGARVEIGQLQINPWVLQVTLRALVMHGGESGKEHPLCTARELVVRLSPHALLRGDEFRFARLDLQGATIHLYTRSDGTTNLPGQSIPEGLKTLDNLVDLGVGRLVIAQSNIFWDDRQWPLDLSARDLAVVIGLKSGSYSGSVSATAIDLSNSEFRLPGITVSTRMTLARNTLRLDSLVWRSTLSSGEGSISLRWIPSLESQFSFRTRGDAGWLARILRQGGVRQGSFTADGEGSYDTGAADVHGHVEAHRLVMAQPSLRTNPLEISADYDAQAQRLRLSRLTATLLGGSARGTVEASLAGTARSYKADLDLQDFDVSRTIEALPAGATLLTNVPVSGRVSGKLLVYGRASRAESQFDLQISSNGSMVPGREPLNGFVRGSASYGPRPALIFESAELHTPHSTIKLHGDLEELNTNLSVQVDTSDFAEWRKGAEFFAERPLPVKLDSPASFSGTVSGSSASPLIAGHLHAGAFEYETWKWTGLEADVAIGPGQLHVTSGRLTGPHSALTLESTAALQDWHYVPGAPFEVSAHADRTSIQGLRQVLGIDAPLSGEITGEVHLKEHHAQLAGDTSVQITAGNYAGEAFDSLDAAADVESGGWKLTRFVLKKHGAEMTAQGTFDPGAQSLSAQVQGHRFELADFARLQSLTPSGAARGLAGTLAFDLKVEGSLNRPAMQGDVQVEQLKAGEIGLGDLSARLQTSASEATLKGQLQGPGGSLDFQGTARIGSLQDLDWPVSLNAHYSGLRLDPWMRAMGASLIGAVETTGSFDYSGTLRGAKTHITSEVQSLSVRFAGLEWRNDHAFNISLANEHLEITPFDLQGPSTEFRFQGTADFGAAPALDLRADGQIDSQFLHVFDPALLTTGRFGVQVRVQGSLHQPLLYGSLTVNQVSIGYPKLPLRLAGLNGTVALEGDRLTVQSLHAESGPASVTITGSATLSDTPRYSLRADFSHMRVAYPVQFTSVVSGSARLSGTRGAGALTGDLTVEQMFVGENFNVLNWASALATQPAATLEGPLPLSSGVRMDVHVTSSPTVSVESHDFSAVAAIDLSLRGTLADPVVFGNVHIQSGQAVLRQTSYKLTHGDVILANPLRTEPTLDLEATTRIQRYDLVLRITGPADRPNVSYRSDPPLSTPSILALLAFGYSTQDQMLAQTGRSSFGTQGASALLSQALSSQVSSRVTRLFGLSRISIDPNPISTGGTQVTVEERLARDFTITYVTTTGGVLERIIQVDWDLSDSMSLLGIRDQNGVYGFELDFRKRFK